MVDTVTWADAAIAVGTAALVAATGVLAGVAWFQIAETRKSAREIFAREARREYFILALENSDLVMMNINLKSATDRGRYFNFLSIMFSTVEDAVTFLDDHDFSSKFIREDVIQHIMFLQQNGIIDWKFHFSKSVCNRILAVFEKIISNYGDSVVDANKNLVSSASELEKFNLSIWTEKISNLFESHKNLIEAALRKWDWSDSATDQSIQAVLGSMMADSEFKELPKGQKDLVLDHYKAYVHKSVGEIVVEIFSSASKVLKDQTVRSVN